MKIREYEFEGTSEEYLKIAGTVRNGPYNGSAQGSNARNGPTPAGETKEMRASFSEVPRDAKGRAFVNLEQARRILKRRPVSPEMKDLLIELYKSGDNKVPSKRLMEVTGFTDDRGPDRFRGLLGAFGRRVKHDVGADVKFFDKIWNTDQGECEYTLPQTVRQAIEALGWVGPNSSEV
jgi:hypothetical protein